MKTGLESIDDGESCYEVCFESISKEKQQYFFIFLNFRKVQAFDPNAFDDDSPETDGSFEVMKFFERKNRRTLKIFDTSPDADENVCSIYFAIVL